MNEHTLNVRLHVYHDTCPLCYAKGAKQFHNNPRTRYRCRVCGASWRWNKHGSLVLTFIPARRAGTLAASARVSQCS